VLVVVGLHLLAVVVFHLLAVVVFQIQEEVAFLILVVVAFQIPVEVVFLILVVLVLQGTVVVEDFAGSVYLVVESLEEVLTLVEVQQSNRVVLQHRVAAALEPEYLFQYH
jgi:hypothetical protein